MQTEIDFVLQGPLYKTQKAWIHPENDPQRAKPMNVLWTSPVNPKTGESAWLEFCREEDCRLDFFEQQRWHIVPHDDCKILTLLPESAEVEKYTTGEWLDFEAIAKDYDALYVPEDTMRTYNYGLLKGWDVATCIFLKPKFTVMNDETYELLKAGKIKPEEKNAPVVYNPEVNLLPHTLPPFKFKQPADNSMEEAIAELKNMADKCSKRTEKGRNKAKLYCKTASLLEKYGDFKCLAEYHYGDNYYGYESLKDPEIAEVLLKHGMNPNLKIKDGALSSVAHTLWNARTFKLFLQYGLDPNTAMMAKLEYRCNARDIKLCLSAGANPNFCNKNGVTPLMKVYEPKCVEWLLAAGANPLAVDKAGRSVKDYQEKQPIYNFRVINCKMLDIAAQNLYINDKLAALRKNTDKKAKEVALDTAQKPKIARWEEKIKADKKANSLG